MKAADGFAQPRRSIPTRRRALLIDTAKRYGVNEGEMLRSRKWAASYARHEFWHAVRSEADPPSLPLIGSWFGMDHTTVIHGIRSHERKLAR